MVYREGSDATKLMNTSARTPSLWLLAATAALALSGCASWMGNTNYPLRRATAVATYCPDAKVEILEVDALTGKSWTAKCGETTYACTTDDARMINAQCTVKIEE